MRAHQFWAQNGRVALNENFLGKTTDIIPTHLLALSILENFLKTLEPIQSSGMPDSFSGCWLENFSKKIKTYS